MRASARTISCMPRPTPTRWPSPPIRWAPCRRISWARCACWSASVPPGDGCCSCPPARSTARIRISPASTSTASAASIPCASAPATRRASAPQRRCAQATPSSTARTRWSPGSATPTGRRSPKRTAAPTHSSCAARLRSGTSCSRARARRCAPTATPRTAHLHCSRCCCEAKPARPTTWPTRTAASPSANTPGRWQTSRA